MSVGGRLAAVAGARAGPVDRSARTVVDGRGRPGPRPRPGAATDVLAVAAALRAGASPSQAWLRCWGVAAPDGVPALADARRVVDERHARAVVAGARLASRTGAPLAAVLERVGAALAEDDAVEVQRRAALAGPQATVRVLTWLPVVGVVLGWALGADPVGVLLDGGLGTALLLAAALLTWAGRRWSARLLLAARAAGGGAGVGGGRGGRDGDRGRVRGRVRGRGGTRRRDRDRGTGDGVDVPVVLDLLEAACAAGSSVPGALEAVGGALGTGVADGGRGAALVAAAARLHRGCGWREAWSGSDPALAPVADALRPSWEDGVAPAGALRATAAHLRRERQGAALAAAGRLGVRLVLPLAVCHLPAFVLVGLVPVLVSAGGAALH